METVVIENPILNGPYREPTRHFRFTDEGITNEVVDRRRMSAYFVPIAPPKGKGPSQLQFGTEWTQDRLQDNQLVNAIRARVNRWRHTGYPGVTSPTAQLLAYWTDPARDKPLFFCQIEALETVIYITEVAQKTGDGWIAKALADANALANPGLPRLACKMATGSGKTVVMAMLIVWHTVNKRVNPQDARFSDAFLIVTPGITIRDRLRVLLPSDPDNYYRQRDLVPVQYHDVLGQAKIVLTNYHAFQRRETMAAGKITKAILAEGHPNPFVETPDQMVRRVCRDLGTKRHIVVLNDEAHHCYRGKPEAMAETLGADERSEAKERDEAARVWISGLEAIQHKMKIRALYDLSATPFFLRGSGYVEGTLFPWVVSDFALIDAIESGIVKIPRVPVSDDSMTGEQPTYRDLWWRIRDQLPKRNGLSNAGEPNLPIELQGALLSLYGHYEQQYRAWTANHEAQARGLTPPVFIVVCNNTVVSKAVYDFIAGWERGVGDQTMVQAGRLDPFRNDDGEGHWRARPNTILVDSHQLESGSAMSESFKKIAAREIEEFKADYHTRFPGRSSDGLTDEDLLREVMNTVGKAGKLGEPVRCVVSVSMLTEGWDANTVTHILGVRAFGTQLLCEQVVGRALRRMSYAVNEAGCFEPEYAEVYGVPFSFIPTTGGPTPPKPGPAITRVRALAMRRAARMTFPKVLGYRLEWTTDEVTAHFTEDAELILSTKDVPTETINAPIVGESSVHTLDELKARRPNEVAFGLAQMTLEHLRDGDGNAKPWLFPDVLRITQQWIRECVRLHDHAFLQLLLLPGYAHAAADRIFRAITLSMRTNHTVHAMFRTDDPTGSTDAVDFDTVRPVFPTRADKCHVSHVVADTAHWEQKMAQVLETMPEVRCYVKNDHLGFTIPYTIDGRERQYVPDFMVRVDDGRGPQDLLNLLVEVTGEKKTDKAAKVATTRSLWLPAVNRQGRWGRWDMIEVRDPWNAEQQMREHIHMSKPKSPKEADGGQTHG